MQNASDSMVESFLSNGGSIKKFPILVSIERKKPEIPKIAVTKTEIRSIERLNRHKNKKQFKRLIRKEERDKNRKIQAQAKAISGSTRLLKVSESIKIVEDWIKSGKELPPTKYDNPTVKTKRIKKEFVRFKHNYPESFYTSDAWRSLRYQALKLYGRVCVVCGATPPSVVLHVDHIKPRSKFPELELEITNLQVLCADCNLGKSNTDSIDWR